MKYTNFLLFAVFVTVHHSVNADGTCTPDEKGKCAEKTPSELFTYMSSKLALCLNDTFNGPTPEVKAATKHCSSDPLATQSVDCFNHCIWTQVEGMTPLNIEGKAYSREDYNVIHGILSAQFNSSVADTGTAIYGRCKPLLKDDPLFPPMERCSELNGFYRCAMFNFLKEVDCKLSNEESKIFGILHLSKLSWEERRKRK